MTTLFVTFMTFLAFNLIPGNSALTKLGLDASSQEVEALERELGLDLPLTRRYTRWISQIFQGDLGLSLRFNLPVAQLLRERIPLTTLLALTGLLFTILLGIPLGLLSAKYNNRPFGLSLSLLSQIGLAIPSFWLGLILTYVFGLTLRWFIPGKYISFEEGFWQGFRYFIFPSIAIAVPNVAIVIRYLKNTILEQSHRGYVQTAYAKGLRENQVLFSHVLRNSLIPTLTVLGMMIPNLFGGSIIVEKIFSMPGVGSLLILGISSRDFPLVQGVVLYITLFVTLFQFLMDLLYHLVDPRISIR